MTMREMIDAILANASPAELRHMKAGDTSVAAWLADRTLELTPTQLESISIRIVESLK